MCTCVLLHSYFGLYLDNTKELRKRVEDGNLVIDSIEALRGAECTPAEFAPPEVVDASITGEWGGGYLGGFFFGGGGGLVYPSINL